MSNFKNETHFKMGQGFDDPFTRVPNIILDEKNISAKALGIYVKIIRFQNSPDHKIYISSLANDLKEGVTAIRSAIHELMELGYIERTTLRNEKGHMDGYCYVVHAQPVGMSHSQPSYENPTTGNPKSDGTSLKKKIGLKENKKKENKVVAEPVINLYKSFRLEKRVMPHTTKLLKEYVNKIDLDVFEQIFIDASSDSVSNKYKYMKTILESLDKKGIKTLVEYENDNKQFKESKTNTKSKGSSTPKPKKENKLNPKVHNFNGSANFMKYTDEEIEAMAKAKLESNADMTIDPRKAMYDRYMTYGAGELSIVTVQNAKAYALENNLPFE